VNTLLFTAIFSAALAFVLGIALGVFRKVFHVETDVLVSLIRETLPGANCGACGFPGCDGFATAVAAKTADPAKCSVSSAEDTKKRGDLLGVDASAVPKFAVLACQGSKDRAKPKGIYVGVQSCRGAKISTGGTKLCSWGCLGFGDCVKVCKFGAISIGDSGIPVIDKAACTGCGMCSAECPQSLLKIIRKDTKGTIGLCSNRNPIKAQIKKTCTAGCIKCESCKRKCPEEAIHVENGTPVIDYAKCTSCGICIDACPDKVLQLIA
jgi:Na+-translocating ferredoxin:NAD+ oxidoreductase RNF subunit RnfB